MKLRMKVTYKKVVDTVEFLDADKIDRTQLAAELTKLGHPVTRPLVAYWIKTGKVPDKFLPALQKIDFLNVITNRKRYERKKPEE